MKYNNKIMFVAHKNVMIPKKGFYLFNTNMSKLDNSKYSDVSALDFLSNLESDVKGYYQYRRFLVRFNNPLFIFLNVFKFHNILTYKKIKNYLNREYDMVVPIKHIINSDNMYNYYAYNHIK